MIESLQIGEYRESIFRAKINEIIDHLNNKDSRQTILLQTRVAEIKVLSLTDKNVMLSVNGRSFNLAKDESLALSVGFSK